MIYIPFSCYAEYFISYRPPHRVIDEYGYDVIFMDKINTSMHGDTSFLVHKITSPIMIPGSGENHTAYFYKRSSDRSQEEPSMTKISLPGRKHLQEEDLEVVCDPLFLEPIRQAIGPLSKFMSDVDMLMTKIFNAERPKRVRKARK